MVGAIDERGRLPASTRFATGLPSSTGANEKSVSSLLSRNPPSVISRLPNASSIVVVIATALPSPSTIEMCDVDGNSSAACVAEATFSAAELAAASPAGARPRLRVVRIRRERARR